MTTEYLKMNIKLFFFLTSSTDTVVQVYWNFSLKVMNGESVLHLKKKFEDEQEEEAILANMIIY